MKLVPISALTTHNYCQCQIILRYIRKMYQWTPKIYEGITKHNELELDFKMTADINDTIDNIKKRSKTEDIIYTTREFKVRSIKEKITGKIDEIEIHPDKIIIIDDKPNAKAYLSSKLQVTGYCIAFQDTYKHNKDIYSAIRDRDTGTIVWINKFEYNNPLTKQVKSDIKNILSLVNEKGIPKPPENENRCYSCGYNAHCTYKPEF